jgi:hypothetical protein
LRLLAQAQCRMDGGLEIAKHVQNLLLVRFQGVVEELR